MPLKINHHPPFYPMTAAWLNQLVHDWLLTGKLLSLFSAFVLLVMNVCLFWELAGFAAAAGVVLGFAHCFNFLSFSATATSDLFFLALYSIALYGALKYSLRPRIIFMLTSGLAIGLSMITRANAITLFVLFLTPVLAPGWGARLRGLAACAFGCAVPMAAWFLYSKISHSPFYPSENHINFAMTYFSPGADRMSADAYVQAGARFHNLYEVLTYDPLKMAATYARDFGIMLLKNLLILMTPLLSFCGLAGFPRFLKTSRRPFLYVYLLATLGQVLLVNFKTYEYRYYFFIVPAFGASAGLFLAALTERFWAEGREKAFAVFFLVMLIPGLAFSTVKAARDLHPPFERELTDAVSHLRPLIPPGSVLYARKENLPFYTGSGFFFLPDAASIEALKPLLASAEGRRTFLYFGSYEWSARPGLRDLMYLEKTPPWLKLLAVSDTPGVFWHFYEVRSEAVPADKTAADREER